MEPKLEKKYGLPTAICMVVGIVIGSGVFFKAQTILNATNGDMPLGIIAWIIGGLIMLFCCLAFAGMAAKYEKVNGLVDYAEATCGGGFAYFLGWFMSTIYAPAITSVLAWLSARYTLVFITSVNPDFPLTIPAAEGGCVFGPECFALMLFFLCASYAVNALSPKLAGKFQVGTTVIKLIPLGLMAVVGIVYGLANGTLATNFAQSGVVAGSDILNDSPLLVAVCATSFAYEGWILCTSINAELRDSKRNLPKALVIGGIIVIIVYIAYYVGVAGGASNQQLMEVGATVAFTNIFGNVLGNILNLFIAISCMGTMNGLMLACSRGMYSLASRGRGPAPKLFSQIDKQSNMPNNSAIFALVMCSIWGCYFCLANLSASPESWFGPFCFDSSELPIVTLYALYIPIFFMWMLKAKGEKVFKRFIFPILGIAGAAFMVFACIRSHQMKCLYFLIIFIVDIGVGALFMKKKDIGELEITDRE